MGDGSCREGARRSAARALCLTWLLLAIAGAIAAEEARKPQIADMEKAVKQRWLGKPQEALIERLGSPRERRVEGGADYLTWETTVFFGSGRNLSITCRMTCRFEGGKLTDISLDGNDEGQCRKLANPLLTEPEKRR